MIGYSRDREPKDVRCHVDPNAMYIKQLDSPC